jgi:hypothetical protein
MLKQTSQEWVLIYRNWIKLAPYKETVLSLNFDFSEISFLLTNIGFYTNCTLSFCTIYTTSSVPSSSYPEYSAQFEMREGKKKNLQDGKQASETSCLRSSMYKNSLSIYRGFATKMLQICA